jgi:hypothetical protein
MVTAAAAVVDLFPFWEDLPFISTGFVYINTAGQIQISMPSQGS